MKLDEFDFDGFFDDVKGGLDDDSPFVETEQRLKPAQAKSATEKKLSREIAPAKKRSLLPVILVIIVILVGIVVVAKSCGKGEEKQPAAQEETQAAERLTADRIADYDKEIVASAVLTLDKYITDYDISTDPKNWTFAMFDEAGAVLATTTVGIGDVQSSYMYILTPVFENGNLTGMTNHYVSVGETVYCDDGYCDDVFSQVASMRQE